MKPIDLIVGSDHRGLELKDKLLDYVSPDDINGVTLFAVSYTHLTLPTTPYV